MCFVLLKSIAEACLLFSNLKEIKVPVCAAPTHMKCIFLVSYFAVKMANHKQHS